MQPTFTDNQVIAEKAVWAVMVLMAARFVSLILHGTTFMGDWEVHHGYKVPNLFNYELALHAIYAVCWYNISVWTLGVYNNLMLIPATRTASGAEFIGVRSPLMLKSWWLIPYLNVVYFEFFQKLWINTQKNANVPPTSYAKVIWWWFALLFNGIVVWFFIINNGGEPRYWNQAEYCFDLPNNFRVNYIYIIFSAICCLIPAWGFLRFVQQLHQNEQKMIRQHSAESDFSDHLLNTQS
jgi:hypothetical protein